MLVLFYVLWVVPPVALAYLAITMYRRKLHKQYPFFFDYVVFQALSFVPQFAVYHLWNAKYFYEYWTSAVLSIALTFAVIYELFTQLFAPFDGLRDLGGMLFRWSAVVLVLAATLMALTSTPAGVFHFKLVISLERSVRVMQCGIVLLMMLCAPSVGLTRQHRIFGIASGFGIIASIDLISTAIFARFGISQRMALFNSYAHMAAFTFAVGLWTMYLLRPEPARGPVMQAAPSERWNFALSSAMHPESTAPSLPLIMNVVDRTFERLSLNQRDKEKPDSGE